MTAEAKALTAFVSNGNIEDGAFREMVEALPIAIYTTDAQGRLTYFNPAAVRLAGRTPELRTDQWCVSWKIFLPDGTPLPHDQCPMAIALRGGEVPAGVECIAERPDGTRFWFTSRPAVIRDDTGEIVGGINVLVDITDRKNAELQANAQFRAIIGATPECVKIVAPDGTLLFLNQPGLDMIGADSAEDVIGSSVYALIAPEDREKFRDFNMRVCGGEKASLEFDVIGLRGARLRMESHAAPLRHVDGSTVHLAITRNISERKRTERAALLLGAIVDSSDDAIISKDLNGIITSWNAGAQRLFGYTAAEVIGKPVTILIPADRQNEEPNILARLRRGERVDHFETIRQRKDGSLLDISLTISPVKDASGRTIGASKIARDISERKQTERAIQALNSQLIADLATMTRMQRLSTMMMQVEDFSRVLDEILAAGIEFTGADMGNIQLMEEGRLKIAAHRGFETPFLDYFWTVEAGENSCGIALRSGERVVIEDVASSPVFAGKPALAAMLGAGILAVQSTPLVTRGGQIVGMLSTHYRSHRRPADRDLRLLDILARQTADLIERRRAQAALLDSEARFRQLADSMPQIVWTARPDGFIDYYNERWYEFSGFPRDVFGDASWEGILDPEDLERTRSAYYAAIQSGQPYNMEHRFWDFQESRFRWFVGRALPIRDGKGKIVRWFGTSTDIDEQKRVQEDLRRANADLEQFAYSASHDLQEPLRSVKIYSELLAKRFGEALDPDAQRFVHYLCGGASRMEALLRDLLSYTQAGKFDQPTEMAGAAEALGVALSNLASAISETRAQITADPLPSVRVHALHLQQLFQNLVGNAIKYRSPERPPALRITASRKNNFWEFAVADNGIGIQAEYRQTIFGLFKRLHTAEEYSGTGIGLAICQRIVERYGGHIWVESEPGQGSTFRFTLPA